MLSFAGNLLNRTLGLLKKNCDATIPFDSISIPEDNSIRALATENVSICNSCLELLDYARFIEKSFLFLVYAFKNNVWSFTFNVIFFSSRLNMRCNL